MLEHESPDVQRYLLGGNVAASASDIGFQPHSSTDNLIDRRQDGQYQPQNIRQGSDSRRGYRGKALDDPVATSPLLAREDGAWDRPYDHPQAPQLRYAQPAPYDPAAPYDERAPRNYPPPAFSPPPGGYGQPLTRQSSHNSSEGHTPLGYGQSEYR